MDQNYVYFKNVIQDFTVNSKIIGTLQDNIFKR